ncbi:MAG TPA: hypothetical protein VF555_13025 [Variovorax sp.]
MRIRSFRWLCVAVALPVLLLLGAVPAGATSCAGRMSFLDSVESVRGEPRARVLRARVVPFEPGVPNYTPPRGSFMFEPLEFLDGRPAGKAGASFLGSGVLHFMLNVAPPGRTEPLPQGSEWVLLAWDNGAGALNVGLCGSILEVRGDAVHGFIRGARTSIDTAQTMPLRELRRSLPAPK